MFSFYLFEFCIVSVLFGCSEMEEKGNERFLGFIYLCLKKKKIHVKFELVWPFQLQIKVI